MSTELTERDIQNAICDFLDLYKSRCRYRTNSERTSRFRKIKKPAGWPDISGDWDGRALYIEIKKPEGSISMGQFAFVQAAQCRGAIALIVQSVHEVQAALSNLEQRISRGVNQVEMARDTHIGDRLPPVGRVTGGPPSISNKGEL